MSIHDFRESVNRSKTNMRLQTISNYSSIANNAANILAQGAKLAVKIVDENATNDATQDYEQNYQTQLRMAMNEGQFDTDGEGNVITSIDQINANIEKFNNSYLDNYEGSDLSKKKLRQMIEASGDVYTNDILRGILTKQNQLKTKGSEEYGNKIVSSTIQNIAAYNEDTLSRGVSYEDLNDLEKSYFDNGTEWGAKALRYSLYLKSIGFNEQETAYTMNSFEKLAKEEQWFNDVSSYYSDNVIDGSMTESEFYEILDKDLSDEYTLSLLGITADDEDLKTAYKTEALSRMDYLKNIAITEHTQRFNDNFENAVAGLVDSGEKLTSTDLDNIMRSINVKPEFLSAKEKKLYDGFKDYAVDMDWAVSLDNALKQISGLDGDMSNIEYRKAVARIYSEVSIHSARQTMDLYEKEFFADPTGTVALAQIDLSKILTSNPLQDTQLPSLDKAIKDDGSSVSFGEEGSSFSSLDEMAFLDYALSEYYDTGSIVSLGQSTKYNDFMEKNPDASVEEAALSLSTEYNSVYNSLESTQKSYVNDQSDLYGKATKRNDVDALNDPITFNTYATLYGYYNGDIKGNPMLYAKLETAYMNSNEENLNTYLEWCRTRYSDESKENGSLVSFTETEEFQIWMNAYYKKAENFFGRNMGNKLKDGKTVRETYNKIIDAENWSIENALSTNGFVEKNAPKGALTENKRQYDLLAAHIADSFSGYNSSYLESEIMLAYWKNSITEEQKDDLLKMTTTFTSPAMFSLGLDVKSIVDDKLGSGVDETSPWYNSLLSGIAKRVSEIDAANPSNAKIEIGIIIDNAINDFNFGLTQGEVINNLDRITDYNKLSDYLTSDSEYLKYDTQYPDYYGKSFEYMLSRNPSSSISDYYLKPGKVGDETTIVKELDDDDFATALLSEAMGFNWNTTDMSEGNYRTTLFNAFNDLDDFSKTAVIGTVQYGLQVRNTARQLKEDGYDYDRMSNDGRVFYFEDGSYMIPSTDDNGSLSYITYGGNGKEDIITPSDSELNDQFLLYFQNYLKNNFNRTSFSGTELEFWLEDALSRFCEENEGAKLKTDYGFKAAIDTGFELSDSRKDNKFSIYAVPNLNKNFDIKWEKNY